MDAQSAQNTNTTSLAAGTLVTTPDGDKPIEEIKAGNLVLSGVGESVSQFHEVASAKSTSYCSSILRIIMEHGSVVRATSNHVFFATHRGANPAAHLKKNSVTLKAFSFLNDEGHPVHSVHGVGNPLDYDKETNLDIAESLAKNIARDNGKVKIERFAEFIKGQGFNFMSASELKVGMDIPIVKNGRIKQESIIKITEEYYDGLVYDLDIPETRNFAANGVLVHDSTLTL